MKIFLTLLITAIIIFVKNLYFWPNVEIAKDKIDLVICTTFTTIILGLSGIIISTYFVKDEPLNE